MNFFSLLLPFGYLLTLVLSLGTFSYLYRRRKAVQAASLQPWFPQHTSRDLYLSLLELQANEKVPDSVLRAALLRRAVDDITRLIQVRNAKPALGQLLQRGAVGDELWQRFQLAEKEMEAELKDVVQEANALGAGQNWGQTIFQSAGEIAHVEQLKRRLADVEAEREAERAAWEARRSSVAEGFMRELDGAGDEVLVEGGGPGAPIGGKEDGSKSSKD